MACIINCTSGANVKASTHDFCDEGDVKQEVLNAAAKGDLETLTYNLITCHEGFQEEGQIDDMSEFMTAVFEVAYHAKQRSVFCWYYKKYIREIICFDVDGDLAMDVLVDKIGSESAAKRYKTMCLNRSAVKAVKAVDKVKNSKKRALEVEVEDSDAKRAKTCATSDI